MAEIKSTIDLVMERTKHMAMSKEEQEQKEAENRQKKAAGWLLELAEERSDIDNIEERLERLPDGEREAMRRALLASATSSLSLVDDNSHLYKVLECFLPKTGKVVSEVKTMVAEFDRSLEDFKEKAVQALLSDLSTIGISGSAIRPNLAADEDFKQRLMAHTRDFQGRFTAMKKALLENMN